MLGFRVPTTCGKKTSITTYSGEVSPPPANRTTTQCETGGKTGSKTGGETGSETGGETGSETGGETGSETGSETSHLVKLSLPDILTGRDRESSICFSRAWRQNGVKLWIFHSVENELVMTGRRRY